MLLRDHSVRKLIHTSPPWDVPQASPSVSIRYLEVVLPPLNPKLRLVPLQTRSFFSSKLSHFAHFSFSLTLTPPHLYPCLLNLVWIQLAVILMIQFAVSSSDYRPKCSEIVTNSFHMLQTHHKSSAICLNSIQMPLSSSSLIIIQFNVPQFALKMSTYVQ